MTNGDVRRARQLAWRADLTTEERRELGRLYELAREEASR
jgi:hypothetical protein